MPAQLINQDKHFETLVQDFLADVARVRRLDDEKENKD